VRRRGILCAAVRCGVGAGTLALFAKLRTVIFRGSSIRHISRCFFDHRNGGAHHLVSSSPDSPPRFGVVRLSVDLGGWVCYILLRIFARKLWNARRAIDCISIFMWRSYVPGNMAQLASPPVGVLTIGSSDRGSRLRWAKEGVDDRDKVSSFDAGEAPRRSTSSLDDT
jgi:hypothetical protein